MPQKFAIPAFFGNPGVSGSVSNPPNPKYTNLVNPPTPTPPPPVRFHNRVRPGLPGCEPFSKPY
jgi:hypothetical protein